MPSTSFIIQGMIRYMTYDFSPKEEDKNFQPRFKKEISVSNSAGNGGKRKVEVEYKEIRPNVWEKVPGSEKDLGPADK